MLSERKLEANRRNAQLSTGPRTPEGKNQSRQNAVRHGLAGELPVVVEADLERFDARRGVWLGEFQPRGDFNHYALDRLVATSMRIERCEEAFNALDGEQVARARLTWAIDRRREALDTLDGVAKNPGPVVREVESTRQGAEVLVGAWAELVAPLKAGANWSPAESSTALDLLGVGLDRREGRTRIDPPGDLDPIAHRLAIAEAEVKRLDTLIAEVLTPLDTLHRRQAEACLLVCVSKDARLIARYEREAWRRYRLSLDDIKAKLQPSHAFTPEVRNLPRPIEVPRARPEPAPMPSSPFADKEFERLRNKYAVAVDRVNQAQAQAQAQARPVDPTPSPSPRPNGAEQPPQSPEPKPWSLPTAEDFIADFNRSLDEDATTRLKPAPPLETVPPKGQPSRNRHERRAEAARAR